MQGHFLSGHGHRSSPLLLLLDDSLLNELLLEELSELLLDEFSDWLLEELVAGDWLDELELDSIGTPFARREADPAAVAGRAFRGST